MRHTKFWLLFSFLALSPCVTAAGQPYEGPIIDAHGHLGASFDWEAKVEAMDRNKVTQQIVMARYYPGPEGARDLPGSDEDAVRLAERYPGRFFPLVGMQQPLLTGSRKWQFPNRQVDQLVEATERKLASGKFHGIGEFIVRHWAYSPGVHAEQDNPIYSTFMRRMSAIAARFDLPMVIHMEGYPALVDDFSKLLAEYPKAGFVWAHNCGRSKVAVIHRMLADHPNLSCDLAGMANVGTGYGTGWPRREEFTALIEQDAVLAPDMKALYEEFPDRFMLGTDFAHASPANNPKSYARHLSRFRELLGQLRPETARKLAQANAIRIFKLGSTTPR